MVIRFDEVIIVGISIIFNIYFFFRNRMRKKLMLQQQKVANNAKGYIIWPNRGSRGNYKILLQTTQGGRQVALSDKTLQCSDCGADFIFTVGEQEFFNSRGFVNEPKRCQPCRSTRRSEQRSSGPRELFDITCAECGVDAQVPFKPRGDRPVDCSDCFSNNRE